VLQTLGPDGSYSEPSSGEEHAGGINLGDYVGVLKRRIFYFLIPFGLISILGLYFAAIQKPNYYSEGKILVESQEIAPDIVRPVVTAAASERIQVIQQRMMTRDNLLSIANKFGLFPQRSAIEDLMQKSIQIKPVEMTGQSRPGASTIAFTVGFEYGNPEIAMRVASELITSILSEDARRRTSRATEAVKILESEVKAIGDKLDSTQMQIFEAARRPREAASDIPEQEKSRLTALAALRAELIQKTSVYSDAHPAVTSLKKRIAAMEKTISQPAQAPATAQIAPADDIESLKRQREVFEKRLDDANGKLATARLSEKLDRDQQTERLQIIESPPLPQRPVKQNRLRIIGIAFALAAMLGMGAVIGTEMLEGSIRSRHQLLGVVDSHLIVSIPYFATRADIIRMRLRLILVAVIVVSLVAVLGGLAAAIVFGFPVDFSMFEKSLAGFYQSTNN
jgi:uncharacterized protein involved in exopolysaccharide biosynthesis